MCVCVCATCCTYKHGFTPTWGQGGRVGSPVQRSSPTLPRQTYLRACPWILARIAWGASFHFHVHLIFVLCHSRCLAQQRPRPAPLRIIFILFCRYAIPGVWRAFGTKLCFTFIARSVRMMVCHLSVPTDQYKSTCVWFWRVVPSRGQIPEDPGIRD